MNRFLFCFGVCATPAVSIIISQLEIPLVFSVVAKCCPNE